MADYTFNKVTELLKNNSTIQTILDIDALAAPAKAALAGYVASLKLPATETQHLLWETVGVAVLIQNLSLTYYLPSLGNQTPAPALRRTSTLKEKVTQMQSLESKFPKCQILIFSKNAGETNWMWRNTEVIQNSGNRVNTLKLLPYLSQDETFVPGRGTQIGIQFVIDPVTQSTLPQSVDRLTVSGSVHMDLNPLGADLKKNDEAQELRTRLAALETLLQTFGAATATAAGTTGLVGGAAAGQSEFLLRGDRGWQDPAEFVSSSKNQTVNGNKTFSQILTSLKEIVAIGVGSLSGFSTRTAATLFGTGGGSYLSLSNSNAPSNSKLIDLELNFLGLLTLGRINDAYNNVVANVFQVDALSNFRLFNFTFFGDNLAIKIKRLEGVTLSTEGSLVQVAHGLDSTKIVGCNLIVNFASQQLLGSSYLNVPGFEASWQFNSTHLMLYTKAGNSGSILSKPFSALVFYTN